MIGLQEDQVALYDAHSVTNDGTGIPVIQASSEDIGPCLISAGRLPYAGDELLKE